MVRRSTLLALACLLPLAIIFCTFAPVGAPTGPSGPISDTQRIKTLDNLASSAETALLPDGSLDRAAFLAKMKAQAEFRGAGVSPDGSLWAQFADGRLVIVPVVVTPSAADLSTTPEAAAGYAKLAAPVQAAPSPRMPSAEDPILQAGKVGSLPASDKAIVMRAVGSGFVDEAYFINQALNKWKYKSSIVDPTVDNLLTQIQDVGVFYLNTHGGEGCKGAFAECETVETPAASSARSTAWTAVTWTFGLATSTRVSAELDKKYASYLSGGELAYMLATVEGEGPRLWSYAITSEFIARHFRFSENSLVVLDACGGAMGGLESALGQANASVFVGWTAPTYVGQRTRYFFDRLLGINGTRPVPGFKPASPKNRPFDYQAVMAAMQRLGLDVIPAGGEMKVPATLIAQRLGGSFGLLRPTIERLTVNEADNKLILTGVFGEEEGEVYIGGAKVAAEWGSEEIRAELGKATEASGSGEVYVKVGDHESNRVPLTLWSVKFTYTEEPNEAITGHNWLYLDVYWRADVHTYRIVPDGEVYDQDEVKLEPAEGSSGRWACDWSGTVATLSISTITGEGELPFTREPGAVGFTSQAKLDPEGRQITNLEFVLSFDEENTCVTETTGAGYTTQTVAGFVLLPSLLDELSPDAPVTPPLRLDEQWKLIGANRDLNGDRQWPWLKWEDTPGKPAPDKEGTPG